MTVQVFARYPRPGEVKSRLAADIGDDAACELHRSLTEAWLEQLCGLPARFQIELWGTEAASAQQYQEWLNRFSRVRFQRQVAGDLGVRLSTAARRALTHTPKVIQTGTDCAVLTATHVHQIDAALHLGARSAFLPAEDGGYVLSGYTHLLRGQFDHVAWGSSSVLASCLLQSAEPYFVGPTLWDIDYLADYERWRSMQK